MDKIDFENLSESELRELRQSSVEVLEEEIYKFFDDKNNISKKEKKIYQKLETLSRNLIYKHSRKKPLTNISIVHI